jgi:hypothetical protein
LIPLAQQLKAFMESSDRYAVQKIRKRRTYLSSTAQEISRWKKLKSQLLLPDGSKASHDGLQDRKFWKLPKLPNPLRLYAGICAVFSDAFRMTLSDALLYILEGLFGGAQTQEPWKIWTYASTETQFLAFGLVTFEALNGPDRRLTFASAIYGPIRPLFCAASPEVSLVYGCLLSIDGLAPTYCTGSLLHLCGLLLD